MNNDEFITEYLTDAGLTEETAKLAVDTLKLQGFIDYGVVAEGNRD